MTYQVPDECTTRELDPRQVLLADLEAQPDLNRHIAIAWARLAGYGRAGAASGVTPNRVTVLKPFTL